MIITPRTIAPESHYEPGGFGCHELLDRIALVRDMLNSHVIDHPSCIKNWEWQTLAEQISNQLGELYNAVADKHLPDAP